MKRSELSRKRHISPKLNCSIQEIQILKHREKIYAFTDGAYMLHPLVEGSEMRGWALFSVKSYIKSLLSFRCDVLSTSTASSLASSAVKISLCMKRSNAAGKRNQERLSPLPLFGVPETTVLCECILVILKGILISSLNDLVTN